MKSVILECNFYDVHYVVGIVYTCNIVNSDVFENSDAVIETIEGVHLDNKTNDDVLKLTTHASSELKVFPKNFGKFFKNVTRISISYTKLEEIHQNDLKYFIKLQSLDLSSNKLKTLEANLFKFNTELKYIDLHINSISYIHPNVFTNLPKLQALDLSRNACKIDPMIAINKDEVKRILMQIENGECAINPITLECFFDLNRYHHVYTCLVENRNIYGYALAKVTSINGKHVQTRNNDDVNELNVMFIPNLNFIPSNIGNFFKNIIVLKFEDSNLKEINQDDLKQFPKLRSLKLSHNQLETIEEDTFKFNHDLESIYLNDNKISHIEAHVFSHLSKLRILMLDFNNCNEKFLNADTRRFVEETVEKIEIGKCSK